MPVFYTICCENVRMKRAYKYRFYPTSEQAELLA
ncbi:helix-turn-helix domain-containing protein, partial [Moellerella wisconsensis]